MKPLILATSILPLSFATLAAQPVKINLIDRIQTDRPAVSNTMVEQRMYGGKTLVTVERESPGTERVVAYDEQSKVIGQVSKSIRRINGRIELLNVRTNVIGQMVAITVHSDPTSGPDDTMEINNLVTGKVLPIAPGPGYQTVEDRKQLGGTDLLAVESNTSSDPVGAPHYLLQIIDEANGNVLREIDNPPSGFKTFEMDGAGKIKILVVGSTEANVIDLASGQTTKVAFPASGSPASVDRKLLSIGDVVSVKTPTQMKLYSAPDLVEGRLRLVRAFNGNVSFVNDLPGKEFVSVATIDKISIVDIASNKQVGVSVPRNVLPVTTTSGRGEGYLEALMVDYGQAIAVVSQPIVPDSYMPGTLLSYYDLSTGKLLRSRRLEFYNLNVDLFYDKQGRVLAVERTFDQQEPTLVIDVLKNQVISTIAKAPRQDQPIVFESQAHRLVVARASASNRLCFSDVEDLANETCLSDAMTSADTLYSLRPDNKHSVLTIDLTDPAVGRFNRGEETLAIE